MNIDELLMYIDDRVIPNDKWTIVKDYLIKTKNENQLLKEQVKIIKEDITAVYNEMVSLDIIHKVEIDDDVELL